MQRPDWIIHFIANGTMCAECGKVEYPYVDYICDAHTHGMREKYNHPEFQMVIHCSPREIMYVLNTLGDMVRNGHHFRNGELVPGIYEDCSIRLDLIQNEGTELFRVIIPDGENRWPEEKECMYPYSAQILPLTQLERSMGQKQ